MENRNQLSEKKIYDEAIERLESSLTSKDGMKEAIDKLVSLGDYLDAAEKAKYYSEKLQRIYEDEEERTKKRKAGRVVQFVLLSLGLILISDIIIGVALAVREAF